MMKKIKLRWGRPDREYLLLFLILILSVMLIYSNSAVSQHPPQQIMLSNLYPQPTGVYDYVRARTFLDYGAPRVFYVDPTEVTTLRNISLQDKGGVVPVLNLLNNTVHTFSNPDYYINLNHPGGGGDPYNDPPAVKVHTLTTTEKIWMGAPTPPPTDPDGNPIGGTHVFDIAEGVFVAGPGEPGDVVICAGDKAVTVCRSEKAFDTRVSGVISANPKIYMGQENKRQPLALAGIVKCRVSAENGPIKRGDALVTSSLPGHAMRADPGQIKPGMNVGRALEPLPENTGQIYILVNR